MAIFGKLFSQLGAKSDHPLGSDGNVADLVAGFTVADPLRVLQETAEWLDDFQRFTGEIDLRALLRAVLRLDEAAFPARQALLERYFDPHHREHLSDLIWNDIERSLRLTLGAYRHCLEAAGREPRKEPPSGSYRQDLLLALARALRAWASRKKLLRFRYRGPDAAEWRDLHAILGLAGRLGCAGEAVAAYETEPDKISPLQHYLVAVYLELAPLTNLAAQQMEALDRMLLANVGQLELATAAGTTTSHKIDLGGGSGPIPMDRTVTGVSQWRYLSRSRLRPMVTRIAIGLRQSPVVPPDLASSGLNLDQLRRLLTTLMLHWAETPPQRGTERSPEHETLRAVTGFSLARRMIAYSDFARSGRSIEYTGSNLHALFEQTRFGGFAYIDKDDGAAPPPEVEQVNPLDVLEKLELAGDKQMMESWTLVDRSETGLGVTAPGLKSKYQIGSLVCVRFADGIDWHIGVIRRIGRDAAGHASIGLETLAWPASSAKITCIDGRIGAWSRIGEGGQGQLDAILISGDGNKLVLPNGAFVADLELELTSGDSRRRIRLTELTERNEDFELVRFAPAD